MVSSEIDLTPINEMEVKLENLRITSLNPENQAMQNLSMMWRVTIWNLGV